MKETDYYGLSLEDREVLDAAEKVMENAYNPYSRFYVGAALLTIDDRIITGCNVENAVYGLTMCAERVAVFNAISQGFRRFKKMAIISRGADSDNEHAGGPCGPCRQVIYEASQISGNSIEIIDSNTRKDRILVGSIDEFLPGGFGPDSLGIDISAYRKVRS